jgi:hypothetical protein
MAWKGQARLLAFGTNNILGWKRLKVTNGQEAVSDKHSSLQRHGMCYCKLSCQILDMD